jgi:hypothetical protein
MSFRQRGWRVAESANGRFIPKNDSASKEHFRFGAAAIYVSGGMRFTSLPEICASSFVVSMLKKRFSIGAVRLAVCLLT